MSIMRVFAPGTSRRIDAIIRKHLLVMRLSRVRRRTAH